MGLLKDHPNTPLKRHPAREPPWEPLGEVADDAAAGLHWRISMAKALLGHLGGPDPRMLSEMRRLQQRVRDLENECLRLQTANDMLATHELQAHDHDELLTLSVTESEPAYS
jgi:hypothetical protein